ncbi:hypothetical protein [Trichothermofontia sp.]
MNAGQPPTTADMWKAGIPVRRAHPCVDLQAAFERLESCGNCSIDATQLRLEYLPSRPSQSRLAN